MTTAEFVREMKERAASYPKEAERVRREWKALSVQGFIMAAMCGISACVVSTVSRLGLLFGAIAICLFIAGIFARRQGEKFAAQWMELREDALRNAKEAEQP